MKKALSATRVLWVVLIMVFATGLAYGMTGTGQTTLPDIKQTAFLTKDSDNIPLNGQNNMLQYKAGGHIMGFQPTKVYLASLDHALSVEFLGTKGVMPMSTETIPATNALTKAPSLTKESTLTKAPAFTKVLYSNLWEGINLTYESTKDGITETTYHIAPNADVSKIRLRYNVPVTTQKDGSLKFTFDRGYLTESKPIAWQEINGKRIPVTIAFNVSNDEVGFTVGTYNPREPLIIDPTYAWHTFYGSSSTDYCYAIAVDTAGNVYVTGYSYATWGTPLNAYSGGNAYPDLFVLKLNSSGTYQWHTFYGSRGDDEGNAIAVDTAGNVYVTGWSGATWGSPLNAFSGSSDIFVLKLNSSGAYQWHTFYGSRGSDTGYGIALDTGGNVYVTGVSDATWGTPLNAHSGDYDILVLKLDSSGAYQWHTFYGSGSGYYGNDDYGNAIAVDTAGNVYVTGYSYATWGLPLHAHSGYYDIFVLKLNSSGAYQWHTFYGESYDGGYGIAVDTGGNVYVTGYSGDSSWGSPLHAHSGCSNDLFVLKLNSSGVYQWHTFFGSSDIDYGSGIVVDTGGNVYVTGYSGDSSWGSPLHAHSGNGDIYVLKLDSSGAYQWNTFYGSIGGDFSNAIAVDTGGNVYVTGRSDATWGSPINAHGGLEDLFVLKLNGDYTTLGSLVISGFSSTQQTNVPFDITITAINKYGTTDTSFNGNAYLSSSVYMSPTTPVKFSNGVWTGQVTLYAGGVNLTLGASDSTGRSGTSNPFTVIGTGVTTGNLGGQVKDNQGNRLSGATVHLSATEKGPDAVTPVQSDTYGSFLFQNVPTGQYYIWVTNNDLISEPLHWSIPGGGTSFVGTLTVPLSPSTSTTPVVLVPGILGSTDKTKGNTWWPRLKKEDGTLNSLILHDPGNRVGLGVGWATLKDKLKDKGLEQDTTIIDCPWDWRYSIENAVIQSLIPAIDKAKQKTGSSKVNIIAHSMGGLIARAYIQGSMYRNDIDQLIMVGTPNKGSANAYYIWEGGDPKYVDDLMGNSPLNVYWNSFQDLYGTYYGWRPKSDDYDVI